MFGNQFRTWSVQLNVSYPLGRSVADAGGRAGQAAARSADDEPARPRDAGRGLGPRGRAAGQHVAEAGRVDAKARELAEQSLQAEEKRLAVGLSDTFRVLQAQRDLARQRVNELNAIISYNRALVDFEAVQTVSRCR